MPKNNKNSKKDNIKPIEPEKAEEAVLEETDFSYRSQCIDSLSKLLGIEKVSVRRWGNNPNFKGMPKPRTHSCLRSRSIQKATENSCSTSSNK